jgi:hypothetical protein
MILKPIIAHFSDPNKLLYTLLTHFFVIFISKPLIDQIKCDMYFIELCSGVVDIFFFHFVCCSPHSEMAFHISSVNGSIFKRRKKIMKERARGRQGRRLLPGDSLESRHRAIVNHLMGKSLDLRHCTTLFKYREL